MRRSEGFTGEDFGGRMAQKEKTQKSSRRVPR